MALSLLLVTVFIIAAYSFIWFLGYLSSQAATFTQALWLLFSWKGLLALFLGNLFFMGAVFLLQKYTALSIPIIISLGVVVSYGWSLYVFEDPFQWWHLLGIAAIILGVFLLFLK